MSSPAVSSVPARPGGFRSFPIATLLIRGMALGSVLAMPLSLGLLIFFVLGLAALSVVGTAAGFGAAAAVSVMLVVRGRIVTSSVWRGRLVLAVTGATGAAVSCFVLLLIWNGPVGPEWLTTSVQYWAAPVVVGAALMSAAQRGIVLRVLESVDTAPLRVRLARWFAVAGILLLAAAFARHFTLWVPTIGDDVVGEPLVVDYSTVVLFAVPSLVLLVVGSAGLLWPAPPPVAERESVSAVIAFTAVVVCLFLLGFVVVSQG